jgi:hypothetical protein
MFITCIACQQSSQRYNVYGSFICTYDLTQQQPAAIGTNARRHSTAAAPQAAAACCVEAGMISSMLMQEALLQAT